MIVAIATLVAIALAGPTLVGLLTDWWWFRELGFQVVFTRQLLTQVLLFLGAACLAGATLHVNLRLAQRGVAPHRVLLQVGPALPHLDVISALRRVTLSATLLVSLLAGLAATPLWLVVLQALNRTPFGSADAVFGRDIGFYVFTMPALAAGLLLLSGLVGRSRLAVVFVYFLRSDLIVQTNVVRIGREAGIHVAILLAAMLLLTAVRLWVVDSAGLLYSTTGPIVGASYSDLMAKLPGLRVSAAVAVLAAVGVLVGALRGRLPRAALLGLGGYAVVALLGRGLVPAEMQKFVVVPTELTRETPYLSAHIAATRQAWGLDSVEVRDLGGEVPLTLAELRNNTPTLENVRLWERDPLLKTFGQLQELTHIHI
ncbi:MAG: hypothetical protein FIA95_04090 [Gemmatimonadetes bacterium]|nr:hypothetical protein [Gemmatimonadota bacterium]